MFGVVEVLKLVSYVVFDVYFDLCNSYEDNFYNYVCVVRWISELGVKEVIFGIRSGIKEEVDFVRERDILWVYVRDYSFDVFVDFVEVFFELVYFLIDIDVFDFFMVFLMGIFEVGGLRFWEVVEVIEWLVEKKEIVGFDIMEVVGEKFGDLMVLMVVKFFFYFIGVMVKFGDRKSVV